MTIHFKHTRAIVAAVALVTLPLSAFAAPLQFSDLKGWWIAEPSHGGESSPIHLYFTEVEGKPTAQMAIPDIGAYDIALGAVTITDDTLDTQPLSFPLKWDSQSQHLKGLLPKDAAPIYDIPVEFRRGEALAKPAAPQWTINKPKTLWSVEIGGPAWAGLEIDPRTQLIFAANDPGTVHAIDTAGAVRWRFETGRPIRGRPAVIGSEVYVASDSGFLYALDTKSGTEKWRAKIDEGSPERIPTNQEKSRWDRYNSSVVFDGTRLFVASRDKNLYALDVRSGKQLWRVATGDMMTATPALYRDLVILAGFDGKVQALSAKDGAARWTYDAKLAVAGDVVVDGDRVFVGSRTYDLIALDASSGKELWKHYYWFSWIESPAVVREGTVYTGSSDGVSVYAIDANSGALRWKTPVPGWAWARTAIADDLLVAGTVGAGAYPSFRAGSLVGLDRRSGAIRWLYLDPPTPEIVQANKGWGFGSSPLIVGNRIYAMDLNGRVYAFTAP
jgi:outer membrane protein assembly factor BamB